MRKIQMERKLFEWFGFKFFVFENFKDSDLNIDDKSIYKFDDEEELSEIFATKKFFNIWSDKRRLNSSLICACESNLSTIVGFLKKLGLEEEIYSTSNCDSLGDPTVLYLSQTAMYALIQNLGSELPENNATAPSSFISQDLMNIQ